jgi:tetratricopeptide (TPR) repeat protein
MPKKGIPMHDKERAARLWLALFALAVASWVGCIPARILPVIMPAEAYLEGMQTIAVLKFDGSQGETVRRHINNRLSEVIYFRSIDIPQVLALESEAYDQVDNPKFFHAIKELGADGVITGCVTAGIHDIHGTDQVQVKEGTGHYKEEKNVHGQWVDVEIKRTVVRSVPYINRQAYVETEYNLFDVKTMRVVVTGILEETYDEKFGGDKEYGSSGHRLSDLPSPDGTVDELAARLATKLVVRISRMKLARMIKFDEGEGTMVKHGVELAKDGDWEEAIEVWEQEIHNQPENAAAYYNLGMTHESLGDIKSLRKAEELYKRAMSHRYKKLYKEAAARVEFAIKESRIH